MLSIRTGLLAIVAALSLHVGVAKAQTTHTAYLDLDSNAATGCSVATAAGAVSGIEARLTATVSGQPPIVTALTREPCTGGVFGAPLVQPAGYPVGLNNGIGGSDVVEFSTSRTDLGNGGAARIVFVSATASGADLVEVAGIVLPVAGAPLNEPAVIPATGILALLLLVGLMLLIVRRHPGFGSSTALLLLFGAGVVWAANFMSDGQVGDWVGESPRALDASNDSTSGEASIDLVAVFAEPEGAQLFIRMDVREAQNEAPTANAQAVTVAEEGTITITLTGSDPEASPLTFAITSAPALGTLSAIMPIDGTSASVNYTGSLDQNGADSFTFTVNDGGATSTPAAVSISLTQVDDQPVVAAQALTIVEDSPNGTVVGTATATDGDTGQTLVWSITGGNTGNAFAINPASGQITVADFAAVTPGNSPFALVVRALDNGMPPLSGSNTITITVTSVNDEPSFTAGPNQTVVEDDPAQSLPWATAISAGPPDEAGQTLAFTVSNDNNALFSVQPAVDPTGVLSYQLAPNANGLANVSVFVMDNGGTAGGGDDTSPTQAFTITVTAVNDTPTFTAGPDQNVPQDSGPQLVSPWATGISAGPSDESAQTVTFNITNNTNAPLFSAGPTVNAAGVLSYTSAVGAIGTADVTLTLQDNGGGADTSAAQTFTITVTDTNEVPVPSATPPSPINVPEDAAPGTLVTTVAPNDPDVGQTHGYAFFSGNTGNVFAIDAAGAITVVGALNFEGSDDPYTLVVRVTDNGVPVLSGDITIAVTLGDVNDSPVITSTAPATATEDALYTYNAIRTDDDGPGQTWGLLPANTCPGASIVAGTGVYTFTPTGPTPPLSCDVAIRICDGGTPNLCDTQTTTVTITTINSAPTISNSPPPTATEDTLYSHTATLTDLDGPGQTWSLLGSNTCAGASIVPGTGAYSFTPTGPTPPLSCDVAIQVCDGGTPDVCATQSTTITITAVNDAPVISTSAPTTATEDALYTYDADLTDPDGLGQTWTLAGTNTCAGAAIVAGTGAYSFTPTGPTPPASCDVGIQVCDGGTPNECVVQTTTVTITPINSAPVIDSTPPPTATEDTLYNYAATRADLDGPGQTWSLLASNTCAGTSIVAGSGAYSFTPAGPNPPASCDVAIQVCDGGTPNECDTQTTTITITAVNDPPVISTLAPTAATENVLYSYDADLTDPDGVSQTWTLAGTNTCAAASIVPATGVYTFTPAAPAPPATCTVGVQVCDGGTPDQCTTQSTLVTITAINDAPTNNLPGAQNVNEDTNLAFSAANSNLISITDPDAGANPVQITLTATNGVLTTNGTTGLSFTTGDGTADATLVFTGTQAAVNTALNGLVFRSPLNYFGPANLDVSTNDQGNTGTGGALSDTDSIAITVNPVNDAPTATAKTHTTHSAIELEIVAASHTGELLEGAADVDDPVGELTAVFIPGSATPAGAQVVVTNAANGSFRYDPPGGFSGTGGFQFQICDDGAPTAPQQCSAATAVTFTVTGPDLWFVDDNATPGGDGGLNDPFDALSDLPGGRGDNDRIFVFAGNYPTAVHSFLLGEHLVGQGAIGTFDTLLGVAVPANGTLDARPATTGAVGDRPTLNRIVMAGANNATMRGVALSTNTDAVFINGTTGVTIIESSATSTGGGVNINNSGASAAGISFSSVTSSGGTSGIVLNNLSTAGGTFNFGTGALSGHSGTSFLGTGTLATVSYAGSISKTSAGRLIDIGGAGAGNLTLSGDLSCINSCGTGAGNHGLRITGRTGGTLTFSGAGKVFSSSAANPGVSLTGNTGATLNFTGGGLAITSTGGTGFEASGGGVVNVTGTGNSIGSTTGAALIVDHPAVQATNLSFATVAATGATSAHGIRLNNISGAVTVSGATSIGGKATAGIEITNSSATIALSNASTVTIANRPSTGIRIANSSGIIGFGATTINSSGVGTPAIRIDASSSAITFSQTSISMGGAGGNENFLIGAGPSADAYTPRDNSGDGDAIYVTGLTGALTINGGTITQPGDDGIDIRSSSNLSVSSMTFIEPGRSAGAGCVDCNSSGIQAFGLTGLNSVSNSTFLRGRLRNLYISNPSGTTTLNVSGSTFDDTRGQGSPATDNLQIYASGTASAAFDISNSTFLKSATNQINAVAKGNAVITQLDITGITMDNDGGPSSGIRIDAEENSQVAFNVIGNPVLYSRDENVVTVSSGGTAQLQGRIANNPDMRFTTSSAGGSIFVGMRVLSDGSTSRATVAITNNALNVNNGTDGIVLTVQGIAGARIDADVRNNQINAAGTPGFPLEGINAFVNPQIGAVAPTKVLCLSLFGNTANNAWARAARVRAFRPTGVYMTGFTTDVATTWAGNGNVGTPVVQFVTDGGAIGAPPTPCAVPTNPLP